MKRGLLIMILVITKFTYAGSDTLRFHNLPALPDTLFLSDCASFVIDSVFYVVGGIDGSYHNKNRVWGYNIRSG